MSLRVFGILLLAAATLRAEATILAYGEISASALDSLGDTIGGLGSAVAYDAKTGCVFMMPDRGAGDGSIDYRPRCYRIRLTPSAADPRRLEPRIEQTILFRDAKGRLFSGLVPDNPDSPSRDDRRCLDPEAIAVAPDGSLYVSDEYGPSLLHFDRSGRMLREIPLPKWYLPRSKKGQLDYRSKARLASGRTENQGPEAMGILPGGDRAVLIFQSALAQDGGKKAGTSRILILDLEDGRPLAEYAYAFGPAPETFADLSINDLAVVDAHSFLVLERDGLGRSGPLRHSTARYKAVWLVDVRKADNLLEVPGMPYAHRPGDPVFKPLERESNVIFARKTLLFNLPDITPSFGMSSGELAAKWEGLTLLPPASKHSFRLLMTADNDFLNPVLTYDGITTKFPRAVDRVPTQFFEIVVQKP